MVAGVHALNLPGSTSENPIRRYAMTETERLIGTSDIHDNVLSLLSATPTPTGRTA